MKFLLTVNFFLSRRAVFFKIVLCSSLLYCNQSVAETNSPSSSGLELYKMLFLQQQKAFEKQQKIIEQQGKEIEKLKFRVDSLSSNKTKEKTKTTSPISKPKPTSSIKTAKQNSPKLPDKPVGKAPPKTEEEKRPPEIPRVSSNVGGVLTKKGKLAIEPSLQYSYTDNNRVFLDAFTFIPAIAVGVIDIREIKRHSFIGSLTARYGVTERLEMEFRVPYVYRDDSQRSRAVSVGVGQDEIFNADGNDIGDLELSARYQLNEGSSGWPIFVGNFTTTFPTGKSPFDINFVQSTAGAVFPTELPTGSGYYSFQPSISALYPTDPGVFFGNLSYNYSLETNENIGRVDPGDAIGASFGMGFALNDRSSFSLGYSHKHVFDSKINGNNVTGSTLDIGQFLIGFSYKASPETNINFSIGIGATDDAQDVRLNFRLPVTFDLFPDVSGQ
jgi:hypothetical protein